MKSYKDLQEFIEVLDRSGELIRIKEPVSCELEITEITDRISKRSDTQNKALLFENVKGYDMPLLINAFGSYKRLNLALGVDSLEDIANRIRSYLDLKVPEALWDKIQKVGLLSQVAKFPPKVITGKAPCQEVIIKDPSEDMLNKLPILKCWPADGGHFVTLPLVFTKNPKTGIRNIGMYRLQKYSNNTMGFHVHWHHDGAENYQDSKKHVSDPSKQNNTGEVEAHGTSIGERTGGERRIPVSVAIGADPALIYSATAPLPGMIDESIFAGFLRGKPVELVKCITNDLEVPANAEIILEGFVDLDELQTEGPFGDHTGFYSLAGDFPVFHVEAITHRKNPIYMTTIVGKPPQEDCYLGKATERIFLPLLQVIIPEIIDMNLPLEGVFHNCAIVKIHKKYPGHPQKVMNAIWGSGQMAFTKYVIVMDKDVDIHNLSEVAWRVFANTDPKRDILLTDGPVDILDHASPRMGLGSKAGIDATVKWTTEGFERDWPNELVMSEDVKDLVTENWDKYFPTEEDTK